MKEFFETSNIPGGLYPWMKSKRPSLLRRAVNFVRELSLWISVPLFGAILVIAIPVGLIALFSLTVLEDSWGHHRLASDLAMGDFIQLSTAEINQDTPQPPFESTSPDYLWRIHAEWNKKGYFDWNLTNLVTGQVFNRGGSTEDMDCSGPTRLSVVWSRDSRYVALNSLDNFWHVHVLDLSKKIPHYVGSSDSSPFESPSLIDGNGEMIQEVQAKALEWTDDSTLKVVIFVRSCVEAGPTDVDAGAHALFYLNGSKYELRRKDRDFRETFISDL